MDLRSIGADERNWEWMRSHTAGDLCLARVSFSSHEQYRVWTENGERDAALAGRLRYAGELPAVGDWMAVREVDETLAWMEERLPRRTEFARRAAGTESGTQVLAANVDLVLVVCGLDGEFHPRRLERYLVLARESGADMAVVLNKVDCCEEGEALRRETEELAGGIPVLLLEATRSVAPLAPLVTGRTVVLLGSSGAGKSTITNGLLGEERQRTGANRSYDAKGRHTTSSRMLWALPGGGALIDTPGLREVGLAAGTDAVDATFVDIAEWASQCRFADCRHATEPGCAVQQAIANGLLAVARWHSYAKLRREAHRHEIEQDKQAQAEEKKKLRTMFRSFRSQPKRGRGPRGDAT